MTALHSLGLLLVSIPENKFDLWPSDRSLKLLAEDGRALRRRALKGVGVEIQRGLFMQVARRIDGLALECAQAENLRLIGGEAEAWLALEEVFEHVPLSMLSRPARGIVRPPSVLGEQVLFPGQEVEGWSRAVSVLDPQRLSAVHPTWKQLDEPSVASLLEKTTHFFGAACSGRASVIQVLHDAVSV